MIPTTDFSNKHSRAEPEIREFIYICALSQVDLDLDLTWSGCLSFILTWTFDATSLSLFLNIPLAFNFLVLTGTFGGSTRVSRGLRVLLNRDQAGKYDFRTLRLALMEGAELICCWLSDIFENHSKIYTEQDWNWLFGTTPVSVFRNKGFRSNLYYFTILTFWPKFDIRIFITSNWFHLH